MTSTTIKQRGSPRKLSLHKFRDRILSLARDDRPAYTELHEEFSHAYVSLLTYGQLVDLGDECIFRLARNNTKEARELIVKMTEYMRPRLRQVVATRKLLGLGTVAGVRAATIEQLYEEDFDLGEWVNE